jgi:exopolysaccharide biosynthesis protein
VAVSNQTPMTLKELAHFMKSLGVEHSMAFDGGSSTSLYVDIPEKRGFVLNSAKDNAARRVKSILIVK